MRKVFTTLMVFAITVAMVASAAAQVGNGGNFDRNFDGKLDGGLRGWVVTTGITVS